MAEKGKHSIRSQLIDNKNNPIESAKNPQTFAGPILLRPRVGPPARILAARVPANSARIMAAVPQYRRAWKRRRKTRERKRDLARRVLDWERDGREIGRENGRERRRERRETRKEKGKREKEEGEERMKGRRE